MDALVISAATGPNSQARDGSAGPAIAPQRFTAQAAHLAGDEVFGGGDHALGRQPIAKRMDRIRVRGQRRTHARLWLQRARQPLRQFLGLLEIQHVRLRHTVAEGHHRFVLHHELGHDRRGVRDQHIGSALRGHDLFRLDKTRIGPGQRAITLEQRRRTFGMQGEQPVMRAACDVRGNLVVQHRRRAQPLGKSGAEQDDRAPVSRRAQRGAASTVIAKHRVQFGPAGLGHREMAFALGQCTKRGGGGRALRAIQIEQPAHPEMPAVVFPFLHVEAVKQLHLGAGYERRHPVGGTEHRTWAQRQRLPQANLAHARHLQPARTIFEPGRHRLAGGL